MDQEHWIPRSIASLPWWVRLPTLVASLLVSAFASRLPNWAQDGGYYLGLTLAAWVMMASIWHWIDRWRADHGKPRLKLEPIHLIALGLLIALVGVGWQLYRGSTSASSQKLTVTATKIPAPTPEQKDAITAPLRDKINELTASNSEKDRQLVAKDRELQEARQRAVPKPAEPPPVIRSPGLPPAPINPFAPGNIFQETYQPDEARVMMQAERDVREIALRVQKLAIPAEIYAPPARRGVRMSWEQNYTQNGPAALVAQVEPIMEQLKTLTEQVSAIPSKYPASYGADIERMKGNDGIRDAFYAFQNYWGQLRRMRDENVAANFLGGGALDRLLSLETGNVDRAVSNLQNWAFIFANQRGPEARRELERAAQGK
jgi:hypothetical protein